MPKSFTGPLPYFPHSAFKVQMGFSALSIPACFPSHQLTILVELSEAEDCTELQENLIYTALQRKEFVLKHSILHTHFSLGS